MNRIVCKDSEKPAIATGAALLAAALLIGAAVPIRADSEADLRSHPPKTGVHPAERGDAEKSVPGNDRLQDMMLVDRFLRLPPERLSHMRQTLERLEKMSPDEKESLRQRIQQFKRMHPREQTRMYRNWERVPPAHRDRIRQYWQELGETERRTEREKFQHLSPEKQHQYYSERLDLPHPPRPAMRHRRGDSIKIPTYNPDQETETDEPDVIVIEGREIEDTPDPGER